MYMLNFFNFSTKNKFEVWVFSFVGRKDQNIFFLNAILYVVFWHRIFFYLNEMVYLLFCDVWSSWIHILYSCLNSSMIYNLGMTNI